MEAVKSRERCVCPTLLDVSLLQTCDQAHKSDKCSHTKGFQGKNHGQEECFQSTAGFNVLHRVGTFEKVTLKMLLYNRVQSNF